MPSQTGEVKAMTAERWKQIDSIFQTVVELDPAERAGFLDRACAGDASLLSEVESLIKSHEQAQSFIESPLLQDPMNLLVQEQDRSDVSRRIGAYKVIRQIGHGGMGTVFLASRADDQYRKVVAIKLISRGMDTDSIVSRFRHERQILASLDHPNIARLLEGGTTEDGLPYFVMEHIEGQPIDEFCDSRKLTTSERLELFRTVCSAVHYAHQNLIVHRDLKPSNILVTSEGVPKLLDFGIAKLLKPEMYAQTIATTDTMVRPMTPDYASPEQVRGQPVTTASDVYSLGVLLYELLTGHRPYRIKSLHPEEIERAICDQEPERPSTAITRTVETSSFDSAHPVTLTPESVSKTREGQPDKLRRKLAGDLDNIVLKAMRKEPQRRYASAEQFSEDLRRHIEGLPVIARKDTFAYRGGKFVKRNKIGVAAVAAFLVLTVAAAVAIVVQSSRASRERDKAQKVSAFLVDLFKVSDPGEARGKTITAREILDKGADRIERELQDQPDVQGTLMNTMGLVYRSLGLYDSAVPLLEKSLNVRRNLFGGQHLDVAKSLNDLGWVMINKQNAASADALLTEALAMRRKLLGNQHKNVAESINLLAQVRYQRGDFASAEELNREALAMRRKVLGNEHQDVAQSLNNLGLVLHEEGNDDAAEPLIQEAIAIDEKLLGDEGTEVALFKSNLALVKDAKGELDEAVRLHRECAALSRKLLGNQHPGVAVQLNNLAAALVEVGAYEEAAQLYREAIAIDSRAIGEESWLVAQFTGNLGRALEQAAEQKGNLAEAESLLRRALAIFKKQLGDSHTRTARCMAGLGQLLFDKGDLAGAEGILRPAVDIQRKAYPQGHVFLATSCVALGDVLVARGNAQEAEGLIREGLEFRNDKFKSGYWQIAEAQSALGNCFAALERYDEAEPLLVESYSTIKSLRAESDWLTRRARGRLASLYQVWGKPEKAAPYRAMLAK